MLQRLHTAGHGAANVHSDSELWKRLIPNGHLSGQVAAEEALESAIMVRNVRVNKCATWLFVCARLCSCRWVCVASIFHPLCSWVHHSPCSCTPVLSSFSQIGNLKGCASMKISGIFSFLQLCLPLCTITLEHIYWFGQPPPFSCNSGTWVWRVRWCSLRLT